MKAECVIEEGLAKLETRGGWSAGELVDHDTGAVCAVGALNVGLMMCGWKDKLIDAYPCNSLEGRRTTAEQRDVVLAALAALYTALPARARKNFAEEVADWSAVYAEKPTPRRARLLAAAYEAAITDYNDDRKSKAPVVSMFRRALATLRSAA